MARVLEVLEKLQNRESKIILAIVSAIVMMVVLTRLIASPALKLSLSRWNRRAAPHRESVQ
jgi:hypothetical protein